MSDMPPPASAPPPPGWYPDPEAGSPGRLRWWDGRSWTPHIHDQATSTQGWSQPGSPAFAGAATPALTASGMRPLDAFFADIGRMLKRGWKQLLVLSFALWIPVGLVIGVLATTLIDRSALNQMTDLVEQLDGTTQSEAEAIMNQLRDLLPEAFPQSPAYYAVAGALITVLFLAAILLQVTGVSRIGMDAAANRDVSLGAAWSAALKGSPRLLLFGVLVTLAVLAVTAVFTVLIVLLGALWVPAAVIVGLLGGLALTMLSVWVFTRFAPVTPQSVMAPRPGRWAWNATRGKFWAVLGRYLLWSLLVSMALNALSALLFAPFSALVTPTPSSADLADALSVMLTTGLITFPLYQAVAGLSALGMVPIWRDLTDDPDYRAID